MTFHSFWLASSTLIVFTLSFAISCQAQDQWPEYRGTNGTGQAIDAELPREIDASSVLWKTPIHGKGWSSPVVWDQEIWITTAAEDGVTMSVVCLDRQTGE